MRGYTLATVAIALGVSPKWLDNTLSHHRVQGVAQSRQGVSRKLSPQAILTLYIAILLTRILEMPLGRALTLAADLARAGATGQRPLGDGLTVSLEVGRLVKEVSARLADAVEITPRRQRGRPPLK